MLNNLLFCHGRECYRRNSQMVSYMFYKNVLYVAPIWTFGLVSSFSATTLYNLWLTTLYNLVFTAMPVMWFAVFDQEYEKEVFLRSPNLYIIGLKDSYFNKYVFWRWFTFAWIEGMLLMACSFILRQGGLNLDGNQVFAAVVVCVNVKIMFISYQFTFFSLFWAVGSILLFFGLFDWFSKIESM